MKIITHSAIRSLNLSPSTCYEWAAAMIAKKNAAILPPKTHMTPTDGVFCNVMSCILPDEGVGGVKVVTRYPDRQPGLKSDILLLDAHSGETLCIMDGNWITAMRTGAVAAHSIVTLAKSDYGTIGMLGLGNTARATLLVLASICPDRPLTIRLLKYKNQEESFVRRFAGYRSLSFAYADNYDDLVRGADVVVSAATYLKDDICPDAAFDEGVLVVPVHTRGFMNCDLFFDKVFADDRGHVNGFRYFSQYRYFAEMTDVVNGNAAGRANDRERILAYNIGVCTHDIYFARKIYAMLESSAILPDVDTGAPTQKFWL